MRLLPLFDSLSRGVYLRTGLSILLLAAIKNPDYGRFVVLTIPQVKSILSSVGANTDKFGVASNLHEGRGQPIVHMENQTLRFKRKSYIKKKIAANVKIKMVLLGKN